MLIGDLAVLGPDGGDELLPGLAQRILLGFIHRAACFEAIPAANDEAKLFGERNIAGLLDLALEVRLIDLHAGIETIGHQPDTLISIRTSSPPMKNGRAKATVRSWPRTMALSGPFSRR